MCLAIPGLLSEIFTENEVRMGKVSFDGVQRSVCLECVPEAMPGDYVLVHVGFALSRIDAAEAARVFEILRELEPLPDEFAEVEAGVPAREPNQEEHS
jgi:hydrogenase expression/formation protein HypC